MKKILSVVLVFVFCLSLTGCKKEMPFAVSPENQLKVDYMEKILDNPDEYYDLFMDYSGYQVFDTKTEKLENFMNGLSEKERERFEENGYHFLYINMFLKGKEKEIEGFAEELVINYLKNTRLGNKDATVELCPEFALQDPVGKVKQYMDKNKIVVNEILFPENFEKAVIYDVYPMQFRYRYVIKGTVKGKPFEKEVVQDFYIGMDWPLGTEDSRDCIKYIRDVIEE